MTSSRAQWQEHGGIDVERNRWRVARRTKRRDIAALALEGESFAETECAKAGGRLSRSLAAQNTLKNVGGDLRVAIRAAEEQNDEKAKRERMLEWQDRKKRTPTRTPKARAEDARPRSVAEPPPVRRATGEKKNMKEVKKLIDLGKEKGYLTYDDVNDMLPAEAVSPDQIEDVMSIFGEMDIEVVDSNQRVTLGGARREATDEEEEEKEVIARRRRCRGQDRRSGAHVSAGRWVRFHS